MMAAVSRDKISSLVNSAKLDATIPSKLKNLRLLTDELSNADSGLLSEFLSPLLDLLSDRFSPVRKFAAEIIGSIGLKYMEHIPEIVPLLIPVLKDDTPAVARQAIRCGMEIFRSVLFKVTLQGLYLNKLDSSLESSWSWMLKFRDEIYSLAFQPESDGRRLLALKFMETVVLLYTPDPNGSSDPPADQNFEVNVQEFNISWIRGGHPVLNVGDLSIEASQSLGLLLDQLRFPTVKSLNNLMIILLINSLSAIASKRPAFYGRILPVLLGLDPSSSSGIGVQRALKSAFLSCLNCTHPAAAPWRDRLVSALRELNTVGVAEHAVVDQAFQSNVRLERENDSLISQDEKPTSKALDDFSNNGSRKRTGVQEEDTDLLEDKMSVKRVRSVPIASGGSTNELSSDQDGVPSGESGTCKMGEGNGPVQQLVAMFGAWVAQGEKAVATLEILISSISADLLAEVVMANMRNLPPNCPQTEGDEEQISGKGYFPAMKGSNNEFEKLALLLTNILSQSSVPPQNDTGMDSLPSAANELELPGTLGNTDVPGLSYVSEEAPVPTTLPVPSSQHVPSVTENKGSGTHSHVIDVGNVKSEIPGLDLPVCSDELIVASLGSTELQDSSQDRISSLARSSLELVPSVSTDRSEELSPRATVTDLSSINSSSATSAGLSPQLLLPKISAPVISLTDDQRDNLQKQIIVRITDTYKQIASIGGSQVCLSVLAYLGVKLPLDIEPWKLVLAHILSDYVNHEGHELTLRVLYRLYGEAEEDHDFVSSTAAKSVYEMFLLTVAETLRDSFPGPDKSLNRLLVEVPYLPDLIFKLLEGLCSPDGGDKDKIKAEQVKQGLSIIWSLILLRPRVQDACLKIALKSAIHPLEEVRDQALRLVVNKLYPLPSMSQQIEAFAREMLVSAANFHPAPESNNADVANAEFKDSDMGKSTNELPVVGASSKELSSVTNQLSVSESASSSLAEGQHFMALYFALCTKNHSLLRQIFVIYESTSKAVKQAVLDQIPKVVRAIGSSPELLVILSDPPTGSEELLMKVLRTLTDGTIPSPELLSTIRKLYDRKVKDVEILILVLPFLPKDEVLAIFPLLVNSPLEKFQLALSRVLQGSSNSSLAITPAEALIAIHGIDPERDGIPLKKVTDACNTCFEQRQIFTQQVLAKVLNQLVEQIPLPLLFMRTVLQAIGAFPSLMDFIMEILSRLVQKQIWKYPKLWVGFIKCALLTRPGSFSVLLQLPPAQLENALNRTPALRDPLIAHASQPHIRSLLPRSVLVVLGLASDSQNSDMTRPSHPETGEMGKSEHTQSSHVHSGDTSKTDKEVVTDISKESSDAT